MAGVDDKNLPDTRGGERVSRDKRPPRIQRFDRNAQSGYAGVPGQPDYGGYGLSPGHPGHKYDEFDPGFHQWRGNDPAANPASQDDLPDTAGATPAAGAPEPRDR
jgi:hypothetical protein